MKNNPKYYDAHWMPFTANREFKANPRIMVSAKDSYYVDDKGRKIFDGLSGIWTCGAGHSRPEIVEAVSKQIDTLDYSPAFQFGHDKSFELANRIIEFTPKDLDRVFFTCSGSDAVDSALKIARAYWRHKGRFGKTRLIGRIKGYHGVNFGGISVGGIGPNREMFGQGIEADHLTTTLLPVNLFSKGQPQVGDHLADELLNKIDETKIPSNYTNFYQAYWKDTIKDNKKIKFNEKIIHQSKILSYFQQGTNYKNIDKDLENLLKKIKKDKKYFFSTKDIIMLEALRYDGVNISKKYKNIYEIKDPNIPNDIQILINKGEVGLALLRLVEIIGEDKIIDIGSETFYFIVTILNQLDLD